MRISPKFQAKQMVSKQLPRTHPMEIMVPARCSCILGEGVIWDKSRHCVWWVDIESREILRHNVMEASYEVWPMSKRPTAIALTRSNQLLVSCDDELFFFDPENTIFTSILTVNHPTPAIQFNDGTCDRAGNFWIGSMDEDGGHPIGSLYQFTPDHDLHKVIDGIGISNGIAFSPDGGILYFADSSTGEMTSWDYDPGQGRILSQRSFGCNERIPGTPDGATIDRDGYLWSARWDGWCIIRHSPDGTIDQEIKLPVQRPTNCVFGGSRLSTLYVTTARSGLKESELSAQPLAGCLLAIETPYTGIEEPIFDTFPRH